MNKTELKRLAKDMAAIYLRELDAEAIEIGLEMRRLELGEDEVQQLEKEIQAIIERLER